jgi:hypothetical protein
VVLIDEVFRSQGSGQVTAAGDERSHRVQAGPRGRPPRDVSARRVGILELRLGVDAGRDTCTTEDQR